MTRLLCEFCSLQVTFPPTRGRWGFNHQTGCCWSFASYRIAIMAATLIAVLSPQAISGQPANAEAVLPNVILIMADDMGYGDISCYGGWIKTPHLDALAASGIRFTDFHSSGAVCSPTRAGLMTGRYQQRVGIPAVVTAKGHRDKGLTTDHLTFAEIAKQAGYQTAIFGKWHLGYQTKYNPVHHGFDRFRGYVSGNVDYFSHIDQTGIYDWWDATRQIEEDGYVTHLIRKHALAFIEQNKLRPFCLYLPHEAPHYPYQGPNDKPDRTVGGKFDNHGSRSDKKNAYREMVDELDKTIGEIVAKLKALKLENKTFVFFLSDNGATRLGSNGNLHGFKGSVWEGGHRVPAIASWPATIPAGRTTDATAISLDLFPTIIAAIGGKIPDGHHLDGINLLPHLLVRKPLQNRTLFWRHGNQRAVRQGHWKFVSVGPKRKSKKPATSALFNLADDIAEGNDLSEEQPKLRKQLESKLSEWETEVGPDKFGSQ